MTHSIRIQLCLGLWLLATTAASVPAQERTVIRQAPPEEGSGLVLEEAPPPAHRRQALETWHRGYVRHVAPLRRQARDLFPALHAPDPGEDPRPACRALGLRLVELGEASLHQAPHFAVRRHVDQGFVHLGQAATWCVSKRIQRAQRHWRKAEEAFGAADRLLMRLGL